MLDKGLISQADFDAIKKEVLAIVAAEEKANAVTYGGVVRQPSNNEEASANANANANGGGRRQPQSAMSRQSVASGSTRGSNILNRARPSNKALRQLQKQQSGRPSMLLKAFVGTTTPQHSEQ